jgi:hypothetical protein
MDDSTHTSRDDQARSMLLVLCCLLVDIAYLEFGRKANTSQSPTAAHKASTAQLSTLGPGAMPHVDMCFVWPMHRHDLYL